MANIASNASAQGSTEADVFPCPQSSAVPPERQAKATAPSADLGSQLGISPAEDAPGDDGWGEHHLPRIQDREARQHFSEISQKVLSELEELELAGYVANGTVTSEAAGTIAEIAKLLETMFDCPFGEEESLKSVVVAIQSQTNNVDWTRQIVDFLRDVMTFLRARYVVNDQTVDEVYQIMKEHGLDSFRGSVSDRGIKTHYHLVETKDD